MFEFFQNQKNNEELIGMAERIENKFETYLEDKEYISWWYHHIDWRYRNVDDENDGPKPDDGPYNDNPEDRFERLPRELDYVRKGGYNRRELHILKDIAIRGDMLDDDLRHDDGFTEEYSNQVRAFFQIVAGIAFDEDSPNDNTRENGFRIRELILSWLNSVSELMRTMRTHTLFYIDYTVRQTRMLLELYTFSADKDKEELKQRHLFLMGLKRLKISDIDFMDNLFSVPKLIADYATLPFYELFRMLVKFQVTRIKWITNPQIVKNVQEELFEGVPFAESAYRKKGHKNDWKKTLKPYTIYYNKYSCRNINGRFLLKGDFNGFVGYRDNPNNGKKEIIVGFAGTESKENWRTDFDQFWGKLPISYVQAFDIVESIWIGTRHKKGFKNVRIKVFGHSLGGGLMQYAISKSSADNIIGFGYNSAGLSLKRHRHRLSQKKQIYHLYNPCDLVFIFPATVQLGGTIRFDEKTLCPITAHSLDIIKEKIKKERARIKHNKV